MPALRKGKEEREREGKRFHPDDFHEMIIVEFFFFFFFVIGTRSRVQRSF